MRGKVLPLVVVDRPGPEDYSSTLSIQTNILDARLKDETIPNTLVVVEHDHVYTSGRSSPFLVPTISKCKDVRWVEIGRGGQATYHGPGQLVAYPIFSLADFEKDVHKFLRRLEDVVIRTLSCFGILGERIEGLTGVWVKRAHNNSGEQTYRKISSIGIGVRKWTSYHGLALNVCPDLDYFYAIQPCGQDGTVMTSMLDILGDKCPDINSVRSALIDSFTAVFKLQINLDQKPTQGEISVRKRARPSWLRVKAPGSPEFLETKQIVDDLKLVTVCEEAKCPNMGECWSHGTATFMIMGDLCTRRCSFCSVKDGSLENLSPLDPLEPVRVSQAVKSLGLRHIVITSVNRDDIADMGASHFDKTIRAIKKLSPDCDVEFLIPDMRGRKELVETILASKMLKVLNHNVETVPRLYKTVRPGAIFQRSLDILAWAKEILPSVKTKSGLMVGLGEEKEEVIEVMKRLRASSVDILTIGQYLQPTGKQLPVLRFVTPEEFKFYEEVGNSLGFSHVESGPLVRSSYHAWKHTASNDSPRTDDYNLKTNEIALAT